MGRPVAFVALLAVAVVLSGACSPHNTASPDATTTSTGDGGVDPNDGARSGTRLKLTYYAFSDGTTQWFGLYDSERKENCNPFDGTWPDGNTYCVPDWNGSVVYSDMGCTKPEVDEYVGSTCANTNQRYVLDQSYDACSEEYLPTHLYIVGAANNGSAYYVKNFDGSCSTQITVDTNFEKLYAISSEVSTSELVPLQMSAPTGDAMVGVRSWTSPDGAALPTLLHDATNNVDCTPEYYGDSAATASCAPTGAFDAFLDHDMSCKQPALDVTTTCAAPPYAYTFPSGDSCPSDLASYHPVGSKLASPTLFEPIGTSCSTETASTGVSYYSVGAAIPLAQLQRTPDTDGNHRIQLIHYGDGASLHFRDPTYLYDSQEKAVCVPEQLADGTTRCVPTNSIGVTTGFFFSDAMCTKPIDVVDIYTGPATCAPPTLPAYVRKYLATTGCTANFELHQLTTQVSTLYYESGTTCTKYLPSEEVLYGVGPAISTSDFVTAAITIDN